MTHGKKAKKLLSIVLLLCMLFSAVGIAPASAEEKVLIAVAVNQWDGVRLQMKDYFDNYLAKELNVEFIYSDATGDVASIIKFVQNAWSAGAVAVIDEATMNLSDVDPVAAKCNQLGMYFVTYYQDVEEILAKYPTSVAAVCSEYHSLDATFCSAVKQAISDGAEHSMVVLPLAAQYGNIQQTQAAVGAVQAFREVYGFSLSDEEITEKVKKSKNNYIKEDVTGSEGIKIAINSKTDAETLVTILKKGDYDTIVITGNLYTRFQQPILEAEQAIGKNLRVITMTGIEDATKSSFETSDPFGNPSMDIAMLTPCTFAGFSVALILNAVNGNIDAVWQDGKPITYEYPIWICTSPEEYAAIELVDTAAAYYIYTADDIRDMLKINHSEINAETLTHYLWEYGTVESIRTRRGF